MQTSRKRDLIAQWAFDTRPLLLRFHLWLEDVQVHWQRGGDDSSYERFEFVPAPIRRCLAMSAGVTALGTRLFAPFGKGAGASKAELNLVKKDADAISAYAMSEALWHFTRTLPENHAIMVCLGEGLMPKAGETPEMGANPLLGFGRVYARPSVARLIDARVHRLLNDASYRWEDFYRKMRNEGITIWGAAVDTLENTSRFARGEETGPLTAIHLFNQPLVVTRPYESYMGALTVPAAVTRAARERSIHVDVLSPRAKLLEAIQLAYPGVRPGNVHVWTLGGPSRQARLGELWEEWRALGVHVVEDGWRCPSGLPAFTDSGTYAPTYLVGAWRDDAGAQHVLICDGYAASAEAVQAASLSAAFDLDASLALYSPTFRLPARLEGPLMALDPESPGFDAEAAALLTGREDATPARYRESLREAAAANVPIGRRVLRCDDLLPEKNWRVLAATGHMGPDPYTGAPGVTELRDGTYRVTTQLATRGAHVRIDFDFRFLEPFEQTRLVFSPLLERFFEGEDYTARPVKVSDSGRIRNELQTLCSQALAYDEDRIVVHFDRIDESVIPGERQRSMREVLEWYKRNHPVWFSWLEVA
jgi:hypothetical protein